jgi:tetratricopeptide (TPR) repeat protein
LKKNLKKQIKEDELVSWVSHTSEYVQGRVDQFKVGLIVVSILAIGGGALAYFRSQRDRDAREGFEQALATFHSPVASEAGPNAPPSRFATQAEKYRQALTDLEGVERRYSSHPLAARARYYAALCKIELGQLAEAEATLQQVASKSGGDALEPALAQLALADLSRRKGQMDQAAEAYKKIVDDPKAVVPRDHALMSLAQTLEEAQKPAEAQAAYERLVREFPSSTYAGDAQRRVEYLQARG